MLLLISRRRVVYTLRKSQMFDTIYSLRYILESRQIQNFYHSHKIIFFIFSHFLNIFLWNNF